MMKRLHLALALSLFFLLGTAPAFAEIIDKIVVVINDRFIITLSDVQKERTVQLALGTDLGDDESVADWLVDKYLVEEQMARYRGIEITEEQIQEQLRSIKNSRGLSDEELHQAVMEKLRRAEFANQRFGAFIRISDEELRKYYEDEYVPLARRNGIPVPPFEQVTNDLRKLVTTIRISNELDAWMTELLGRAKVEKVSK